MGTRRHSETILQFPAGAIVTPLARTSVSLGPPKSDYVLVDSEFAPFEAAESLEWHPVRSIVI